MDYLPPRRIAAIHDLSCVGRCALTVIMPTLSVMGCQVIPLPTALLSSHTGGFTDLHFHDLTRDMHAISAHFERLEMRFGAIYTGFLGSVEQITSVEDFIRTFSALSDETDEQPLIFVDPVMGDDGELYSTYTPALADGIRRLSGYAEVLTPNLTEACLLAGTPYLNTAALPAADAWKFAEDLLEALYTSVAPHARIVITGIHLEGGLVANCGRNADGTHFRIMRKHTGRSYPGTGDIFASVLLGDLMRKKSFEAATSHAADFTKLLIDASSQISTQERMGVALEPYLKCLCE